MKVTPNHLQAVIEALVVGLVRRGSSKRKVSWSVQRARVSMGVGKIHWTSKMQHRLCSDFPGETKMGLILTQVPEGGNEIKEETGLELKTREYPEERTYGAWRMELRRSGGWGSSNAGRMDKQQTEKRGREQGSRSGGGKEVREGCGSGWGLGWDGDGMHPCLHESGRCWHRARGGAPRLGQLADKHRAEGVVCVRHTFGVSISPTTEMRARRCFELGVAAGTLRQGMGGDVGAVWTRRETGVGMRRQEGQCRGWRYGCRGGAWVEWDRGWDGHMETEMGGSNARERQPWQWTGGRHKAGFAQGGDAAATRDNRMGAETETRGGRSREAEQDGHGHGQGARVEGRAQVSGSVGKGRGGHVQGGRGGSGGAQKGRRRGSGVEMGRRGGRSGQEG
ncbi:hypothetical protein B0H13DRAFT_1911153 [Mycena leptocephala]|nr:hypothetical protein B0H13DRAFT_1911153 [Mycena leptocephala]